MDKFNVVGIGPGSFDYVLPIALKTIKNSDVLIGGERQLEAFSVIEKFSEMEHIVLKSNYTDVVEYISENYSKKRISVLVSGDTGFYSLLKFIKRHFEPTQFNVVPGISSLQYLFARVGMTWQDAYLTSVHGRENEYVNGIKEMGVVGLLTDLKNSPSKIAETLIVQGLSDLRMIVGERLSYEDEKITEGTPEEIKAMAFESLTVVIVVNHGQSNK